MPVQDNIGFTDRIPELPVPSSPTRNAKLLQEIESMMEGFYTVSSDGVQFVSKRGAAHFDVRLHSASSSRGLSDLYFALRHAGQRHLLIVDGPETCLDTDNQILMARLLAKVVAAGTRVLVTTHSDYLMKEFNNLLMLGNLDPDDETRAELGYGKDVPLRSECVRAYVMKNGTATPCEMGRHGLAVPNMEASIGRINRTSSDLVARLSRASDAGTS